MTIRPVRAPARSAVSPRTVVSLGALGVALLALPPRAEAQSPGSPTGAAPSVERIAAGLTWRLIGPAISGGRISDVEIVPGTQSHIYVGAASGGVWESVNHGTTWEPIFDDAANLSVGDIALAPSDPLEIWVGTGEPNNRNSSPWGEGVYHSSDGGETWRLAGLEETRHIGRIVVHPANPDIVWVAALGHLFGPNPERGVYRTTDRGETWEMVLHIDDDTGFVDLALNPADPSMLYAAAYQRRRRAWGFAGGGPGSGLYKSTDGGDSWAEVTEGLPEGDKGRIGLAVSAQDPALVMAVVEAGEGGIFTSRDYGETWTRVNELKPASDVLQPAPHRPQRRGARLARGGKPAPLRGRRRQLRGAAHGDRVQHGCPRGPPRPVDRPRGFPPHDPGERRRALFDVGTTGTTGPSSGISPSPSSTTSIWIWRTRTTSMAGCRTTTPTGARVARAAIRGS